MCGIAGWFSANQVAQDAPQRIEQMLAQIQHRGPDEAGYFFDDTVALGAVRLSVIDLHAGQQPISDPSERYWIAYNGEIYNYQELRAELEVDGVTFRTHSDTEVVLQLWIRQGDAGLARCNGGFAVALYDSVRRELTLARDRLGKRPLFWSEHNGFLLFGSEIKAFRGWNGFGVEFDPAALASLATLWTPLPTQTPYRGIHQLAPGTIVTLSTSGKCEREFAKLSFIPSPFAGSYAEAQEETRRLLTDAVRIRLRSDIPVGAYLSGGLDSSITTALALRNGAPSLRTFSVAFSCAEFDEAGPQQLAVSALGTTHDQLTITEKDIATHFNAALWHAEIPVFRTAFVPLFLLSRMVRERSISVALSGEGADEFFLGYDIFKETLLRAGWHGYSPEERQRRIAALYPFLELYRDKAGSLTQLYAQSLTEERFALFSHEPRFKNGQFARRILSGVDSGSDPLTTLTHQHHAALSAMSPLQRAQWLECQTLLSGYLLSTQGDRASFAHGVELRSPFLDSRVIEFANSLPQEWRLRNGTAEKAILKESFAELLPTEILSRTKQPYRAPDMALLSTDGGARARALLDQAQQDHSVPFLNLSFIGQLLTKLTRPAGVAAPRELQGMVLALSILELAQLWRTRPVTDTSGLTRILKKQIRGAPLPS